MIIQHGNGITLSGDTLLASQYVQYGKRKAIEVEALMRMANTNMFNKAYWLNGGCIEIMVRVINGMRKIHIHACSGGRCQVVLNLSEDTVPSRNAKIDITHKGMDNDSTSNGFGLIDWGDGVWNLNSNAENDVVGSQQHQYAFAGTYTITYTGFSRKFFVTTGTFTSPVVTKTHYVRNGSGGDATASHADCIAQPWTVDLGGGAQDQACKFILNTTTCEQGYVEYITDLTGENKIVAFVADTHGSVASLDPVVHPIATVNGETHQRIARYSSTLLGSSQQFWAIDSVPVGGVLTVLQTDNGGWTTFPTVFSGLRPFFSPARNDAMTLWRYGCKVVKTIEVTV
jgi:hypothetical protein